tara:strand:+ start:399 stop:653 length:255 start_codon:yes stop_codon:yes gene_type:complete
MKNKPLTDRKLLEKYAKLYNTKEKYMEAVSNLPTISSILKSNSKMAKLTLEGYWVYFNDLSYGEKMGNNAETFVQGYVIRNMRK